MCDKLTLMKVTKGRGSGSSRTGRFESLQYVPDFNDYGFADGEHVSVLQTDFYKDTSRTIITKNESPDVGFTYGLNCYRGCEHGCAYCYARPTHEYLGMSAGLDFETKIFVKEDAPFLLREKLLSKSWKPAVVMMSGNTDCYQPAERFFKLTRKCLEIFLEFKNPVSIITKNHLVLRDLDLLRQLAQENLVQVTLSITSLDADLLKKLEPRTSPPKLRLKAVKELSEAGVPVGVNIAPVIPGLTDHEVPNILREAAEAGASSAGYTIVRLPLSVGPLFQEWLQTHKPESANKILHSIQDLRKGRLNDANFGSRMVGKGPRAGVIRDLFDIFSKQYGLNGREHPLSVDRFLRPSEPSDQLSFF